MAKRRSVEHPRDRSEDTLPEGNGAVQGPTRPARSMANIMVYQLRRNRLSLVGLSIVIAFVGVAVFAPVFATHDPLRQELGRTLEAPSGVHWLGTDEYGRDVLSRVIYGARVSLSIGMGATAISLLIGFSLGVVAGYYGGWGQVVILRLFDLLLAMPGILLAIGVIAALGPGVRNVIIAVAIHGVPQFGRLAYSASRSASSRDYVEAARSLGASHWDVVLHHVVPNSLGPTAVYAALRIATAMLMAAGLSFLGLGVQPPSIEWGAILAASRQYMHVAPHLMIASGGALALLVFGFNAFGEGIRDVLDPKST